MKYQLPKSADRILIILALLMLTIVSCKKEKTEVRIDAFAYLDPELEYKDGVYILAFTLQKYTYGEVEVRISLDKNAFFRNKDLLYYPAHPVNQDQYGIFLNSLDPNLTYYYQIHVKDSQSSQEASSDVFSFKTTQ